MLGINYQAIMRDLEDARRMADADRAERQADAHDLNAVISSVDALAGRKVALSAAYGSRTGITLAIGATVKIPVVWPTPLATADYVPVAIPSSATAGALAPIGFESVTAAGCTALLRAQVALALAPVGVTVVAVRP